MAQTLRVAAPHSESFLTNLVARLRDIRKRRRMYTTTVNELAGLTDRELNEMGIGRFGIRRVAWDYAYGDRD
ncbi:MAG: DUF1127 domain-containing protein [Paracoccaceae bacterium]